MPDMTVQELINLMPGAFQAEKAVGLDTTIQFSITGEGGGDWVMTIKEKQCKVETGTLPNPRLKLIADSKIFLDVITGKMDGTRAFMQGKLKLVGDMSLAMRLMNLFKLS
jgi:putative sterol carrier protein